jgi:Tol biopolymer transport system component
MRRTKATTGIIWGLTVLLASPSWTPAQAPRPQEPAAPSLPKSKGTDEALARAVGRLVEQFERHPVRPRDAADRAGLYLMDLADGDITLIADQPEPGLTHCGSPTWSHDGRRILFDATPGTQWTVTHLKAIEAGESRPVLFDLGSGNCPALSPADDRIAFLSNADGVPRGVWMMKADGTGRRPLGDYGIPKWSSDGRRMMIVSFANPCQVTIMDADPDRSGIVHIPDHKIFSVPSWAGPGTIVAALVSDVGEADALALVDVSDPAHGKVKDVLWRAADGLNIRVSYPVYWPATRRCVFVGRGAKGSALYLVSPGQAGPPKRLGPEGDVSQISTLALSPDGRYLLFTGHGPDRTFGGRRPGAPGLGEADRATDGAANRERRGDE